jgi:hypothetical protein
MPILAMTVHVNDPETGRTSVLNRGTDVQGRVLTLIDNPGVWVDPDEAAAARAEFEATHVHEEDETVAEPPRSGKGSGRDAWAEFAAAQGVQVQDEDTKDDIVRALAEAGVIDE